MDAKSFKEVITLTVKIIDFGSKLFLVLYVANWLTDAENFSKQVIIIIISNSNTILISCSSLTLANCNKSYLATKLLAESYTVYTHNIYISL